MGRLVDLRGRKFERLTVLERDGSTPWGTARWLVQCSCGSRPKPVDSNSLLLGRTRSCGCLWEETHKVTRRLPPGNGARNQVFARYTKAARKRGLVWELTDEVFDILMAGSCFYCGQLPSNTKTRRSGNFQYNGIDRKDNSIGYVATNVVSCCRICNRAKSDLGLEEFIQWVKQVAAHLETK